MSQEEARMDCGQDSADAAGEEYRSAFLTLPRPMSHADNDLYFDTFHAHTETHQSDRYWLDITEKFPATDERQWIYSDGSPNQWHLFKDGEPNDHGDDGEPYVEVDHERFWNDVKATTQHKYMCVYYLPEGAERPCPWLQDYEG